MPHFPPQAVVSITDASRHETTDIGHGRIETRRIIACPMPPMPGWKSVQQCFAIERTRIHKKLGTTTTETAYGITSLSPECADAKRLLVLSREHWNIENQLHWVRDTVFLEDQCTLRDPTAQTINAACNSFSIFLLKQAGFNSITHAIEACADNKAIPLNILSG
jgi:predicted transposase YbfD/YdcC